jgi:hypothetical protein
MVTSRRMKRNTYRILVGKPEEKGPLGRPIHRWVDNIKMHIVEIGWGGMGWIGLAEESPPLVPMTTVMTLRVP